MSNDLARQVKEYLGLDSNEALEQAPSIYRHLSAGAPRSKQDAPIVQADAPGGGSEALRWASPSECLSIAVLRAGQRERDRERQYEPYGPEAAER